MVLQSRNLLSKKYFFIHFLNSGMIFINMYLSHQKAFKYDLLQNKHNGLP